MKRRSNKGRDGVGPNSIKVISEASIQDLKPPPLRYLVMPEYARGL